ncbi:PepSY domain-containing protein [Mediterraneibacter sp. NSJ-55]|uniref:PepSY domain-containing protein n=1 Tax=Mediterraneibacter hominis TaxID=2763054 RepID=A0A923LIK0_9FIRM|nr:PepSY domain-containing protein [Mediterraneibacter hominis]MBC5689321.1 PepSY domain-containing protein [Mediterraneibacter hominis]
MKIYIIVLSIALGFTFVAGCGVQNTPQQDISSQNTAPVNETQTQSKQNEEALQAEIDSLRKELDSLKNGQDGTKADNTQNAEAQLEASAAGSQQEQTQNNSGQTSQQSNTVPKSTPAPAYSAPQSNVAIDLEQAKQIALQKVPGATEQNLAIHLDFDDGFYVYEGDIWYDRMEYEFDIDANSGTILKWEQEYWH